MGFELNILKFIQCEGYVSNGEKKNPMKQVFVNLVRKQVKAKV